MLFYRLVNMIAGASGEALTSADMKQILFSWRSPLLLVLGILITVLYIVIELFAQVYLAEDILSGTGGQKPRSNAARQRNSAVRYAGALQSAENHAGHGVERHRCSVECCLARADEGTDF